LPFAGLYGDHGAAEAMLGKADAAIGRCRGYEKSGTTLLDMQMGELQR